MPEVPDRLAPTDGLTNSKMRFSGLDLWESGEQIIRFEIDDESRHRVGTFSIEVGSRPTGNADMVIADGHAKMRDVLRQWLHEVDKLEQFYRSQATRRAGPS
ncbi:hypothetical protein [Bradyrhizobium amphicarpaeae]|nr:hypothetical protein [Bradyrhizobium amphicarpaeae]